MGDTGKDPDYREIECHVCHRTGPAELFVECSECMNLVCPDCHEDYCGDTVCDECAQDNGYW